MRPATIPRSSARMRRDSRANGSRTNSNGMSSKRGRSARGACSMQVLVNARHLANPSTGVGEYTTQLLRAAFAIDPEDSFTLLSTGSRSADPLMLPLGKGELAHVHRRIPNLLLNASVLLMGRPTLSDLAHERPDAIWLPNLDIVEVPDGARTALTIHDLSWYLFPELYSRKMRAWHAACRPERLIKRADGLLVPSKSTAEALAAAFPSVSPRITVIPH